MHSEIKIDRKEVSALTIDVEDGISIAMHDYFHINMKPTERVVTNTNIIIDLCKENNIKATFFVLGEISEFYPELIKSIHKEGHEIGIHGYRHEKIFNLTPSKLKENLLKAKTITENLTGEKILGFRAPAFSINPQTAWALEVIAECGFEYDSSIFPTLSLRYGWNNFPKKICQINLKGSKSIIEIPMSVLDTKLGSFPACGGGYIRYFPYLFTKAAMKSVLLKRPAIVYVHPYELDKEKYPDYFYDALSQAQLSQKVKLLFYRHKKKTVFYKLVRLIRDFKLVPISTLLAEIVGSGSLQIVNLSDLVQLE